MTAICDNWLYERGDVVRPNGRSGEEKKKEFGGTGEN